MLTFYLVISKPTPLNVPLQSHTWLRYIDDIFMIWTEDLENLRIFIDYFNNIHSTIKFTSSNSSTNIPFLDVSGSLTIAGSISISLYTKPTDKSFINTRMTRFLNETRFLNKTRLKR